MKCEEARALIGWVIRVGSSAHVIARYDRNRRQFVTRNLINRTEGPLPVSVFEDALRDGILSLTKRIDNRRAWVGATNTHIAREIANAENGA